MKKLLKSLACFAAAALVGSSALAGYGWYNTSIDIGGIRSDYSTWSQGNGAPDTDLGTLSSLTVTGVKMSVWDDSNDRGGANMFFRLYGDNGQIGQDKDLWLGAATRITGDHDFSVTYTGTIDLATEFGVQLEEGKTYYLTMWAKTYGDAGDHWYSGEYSDNFHTKFVYSAPKTYTLVESADDLVVGADYLVVSTVDGAAGALKNEANGSAIGLLGLADAAIAGNTISASSDAIVWQLNPGNHRGQRVWYNAAEDVHAAAPATAGDNAQLLADGTDDLAQWTVDTSALPAVKFFSVSYADRYLQRDATAANAWFAAYDSAQATPSLYMADSTEVQTVTFDPNGGTYYEDMLTMKYVKGRPYWGIWKPASREGYKFLGWFDKADGSRVQNNTPVTADDTREFQARWQEIQTVTFDANGGTVRGQESLVFNRDGVYAGFAMPTRVGYTFMGWFDEDGTRVKNGEAVTADVERELIAHWGQTVRFEGNGGTVRGKTSLTFPIPGVYAGFAMPTWDGHAFLGWFDEDEVRVKNGEDVTEDGERTLWAHWRESAAAAPVAISGFSMSFRSARGKRSTTTVQDVLTADSLGLSGSYANFSGKTATSTAVYAGQAMKGSGTIQMRSKNSNSGIVTTGSGGKVAKVAIDWSSGKKVDIYGKNSAYSAATDLYDSSTQGTLIGSITNSSELAITDEYAFIGLRSNDGAVYLNSITIDWLVEGEDPQPSTDPTVTLSASAEEVYAGEAVTITASAANFSVGEDDLVWEWSVNGIVDDIQDGTTFTLDTSVADTYEVKAEATDGDAITNATVSILVKPQTVTLTPSATEVEVGETVTITATAEGFSGAVTWTWAADEGTENGATYTLTPSVAGEYVVMAEAAYGTQSAEASVTITVSEHVEVTGDVLTNDDVGSTSSNYGTWTATKASGAEYAGQSAGGSSTNPCIQLRSNNNNSGIVMTKGSGRDVSSVTIEWNAQSGADRVVDVYGSATAYSSPSDLYGNEAGTFLGSVTNGADEVTVDVAGAGAFPFVGIRSHSGALYLTSVTIEFASATPKVTLAASATEVEVGQTVTITASATGFSDNDNVKWVWFVGNTQQAETGATLSLNGLAQGEHEVTAWGYLGDDFDTATEMDDDSVTITVNAATTKYAITIDPDILQYATVTTDPAGEAAENAEVTVNVTPNAGYVLDVIKVNGSEITGNTFNMPAAAVTVSAEFSAVPTYTLVESADDVVVGADYLIVAYGTGYTNAMKGALTTTSTKRLDVEDIATLSADGKSIATDSDAIVWQLKPGNHRGQRVWYSATAQKFAAAPDTDNTGRAQLVADGTNDFAQWTIDTSALPDVKIVSAAYNDRYLERNSGANNKYFAFYASGQKHPQLFRADSTRLQTVTFDPNGGTYYEDMLTMKYVKGRPYWGIWKPAAREGYKFLGWFDKADGSRVQNGTPVTEDDTREFQARWQEIQTVTFNANGGTIRGQESLVFNRDGVYAGFAKPVRDGYTFMGWFDEDGTRVKTGEAVTADIERELFAHWGQTVRFEGNGGTVRGKASLTFDIDGVYAGFAMPTWDGHTFLGWFDEDEQRVKNGEAVTEDGERTLWAHWKDSAAPLSISGFSVASRSAPAARDARSGGEQVFNLCFETVAGFVYEVQWTSSLDGEWTVLKRWTAGDGVSEVAVTVPDSPAGFLRLAMFDEVE